MKLLLPTRDLAMDNQQIHITYCSISITISITEKQNPTESKQYQLTPQHQLSAQPLWTCHVHKQVSTGIKTMCYTALSFRNSHQNHYVAFLLAVG